MTTHLLEVYNKTTKKNNFLSLKQYKKQQNFILKINSNYSTSLTNKLKENINIEKLNALIVENQNRHYYSKIKKLGNNIYSPYELFNKEVILLLKKFISKNNTINIIEVLSFIYNIKCNTTKLEVTLKDLTNSAINIARNIFNTPVISKEIFIYTMLDFLNIKKNNRLIYNLSSNIYKTENILKTYSNLNTLVLNYLVYKELSVVQWQNILNNNDYFSMFSTIPLFILTQLQYKTLEMETIFKYNIIKKYI